MEYSIESLAALDEGALDELFALASSFFREHESFDEISEIDELTREHCRSYFSAFMQRQDRRVSVAKSAGRIIGYITFYEKQRQCFYRITSIGDIAAVYVAPEHRNRGVGKRLMESALSFFRTRRLSHFSISTSIRDEAGIGFFASFGMRERGIAMSGKLDA